MFKDELTMVEFKDGVTVIIRPLYGTRTMFLFFIALLFVFTIISVIDNRFFVFFALPAIAIALPFMLTENQYSININNYSIERVKFIYKWKVLKSNIQWNSESTFSYELEYDTYKNITSVWLVVFHKDSRDRKKIIMFFSMETFEKFKRIFEKKFNIPIGEWYD